ncbi:MAG TPA: VanW family protein [Chloroflexaceae bacterium]|nr:VanW family protein [Chloroflexaceae bacterium]
MTLVLALSFGHRLLDELQGGRVLPGVAIQGVAVGGLSPVEARAALDARLGDFIATPIAFAYDGQVWSPQAEVLGVSIALDAAVAEAYELGREGSILQRGLDSLRIWREGRALSLRHVIDQQRLQAYLLGLGSELDQPPADAVVQVVEGQVVTAGARMGRQLLIDETLADVNAALVALAPQTVTLRSRQLQPAVADVADAEQRLRALLDQPLTLTVGEQRWIWDAAQLGELVAFTREPRGDALGERVVPVLDRDRLEAALRDLADEIDLQPVEQRLRFSGGAAQIIEPGRDGRQLEVAQAADLLAQKPWGDQRTIELPVTVPQPSIRPDTLADLGLIELVAEGRSSFRNSAPYRIQNIQAGAARIDGVLIAPGAEFSFNDTVGAIDESNGFTKGYAIIDGRTQLEWGGGVCQVSTTVFRAAFYVGAPITERNQHSFRISWYEELGEPPGLDAAIFTGPGGYDLRFVNDTGNWLLMQTGVDLQNQILTVRLYGTRPQREVVQLPVEIANRVPAPMAPRYVNDPTLPAGTVRQTDTARGGFDATVGRIVRQGNTILYQDRFFSRYQPWPDIFVRGTGR